MSKLNFFEVRIMTKNLLSLLSLKILTYLEFFVFITIHQFFPGRNGLPYGCDANPYWMWQMRGITKVIHNTELYCLFLILHSDSNSLFFWSKNSHSSSLSFWSTIQRPAPDFISSLGVCPFFCGQLADVGNITRILWSLLIWSCYHAAANSSDHPHLVSLFFSTEELAVIKQPATNTLAEIRH